MTSSTLRALGVLAVAALSATAQARPLTTAQRFERAWYQWDAGVYDSALVDLQTILKAPEADQYHDRIAELTGEIWQSMEVARDARVPMWSPDGRHLAYETTTGGIRRVHVVRAEAGFPKVSEVAGSGATFSPDSRSVAWLGTSASGRAAVSWLLIGGEKRDFPVPTPAISGAVLYGRNPERLAVLGGTPNDTTARLFVRATVGDTAWTEVRVAGLQPVGLIASRDGTRLLVTLGPRGAFSRTGPGAGFIRATAFAEVNGTTLGTEVIGTGVVASRDGSTIAWIESAANVTRYRARRGVDTAVTVATIERPGQSLSISPDGRTIAFSQMLREDWEIFTAATDGASPPKRVTREIQHDLFPEFVSNTRLFAVMGEARHRRSHLYDLATGTRTRLFHNNSVRTVAPEYEWAISADGSRVAIVAERDGDTVTPHRHLYMMDLNAKVSRAALTARVDSNLTAERELRTRARQMFAPIEARVRLATEQVNVARIYENERSLFGFDSKHITQAGNWPATEWLQQRYASYGLQTQLQEFRTTVGSNEIRVANVLATVRGTVNPDLVYVVGAHFDSRAEGPGADDNTSGTAMILEAARIIALYPQPATVMFVAFTGEEAGLRGAREFGTRMKDSIHVVGALNNDMMGWSNDHRMDNTIRYSNPGLRDVQHAAALRFSDLILYDAFYYKSTDAHELFNAWGDIVAGIGSYPILGNPHYHQPHDVLETINHRQLAETSRATVATIMLMASSPSRITGLTANGKLATWNPSPERNITQYIVRYGPPDDPMRHSLTTRQPRATLDRAEPGWKISIKAVNNEGMEGWDWARGDIK